LWFGPWQWLVRVSFSFRDVALDGLSLGPGVAVGHGLMGDAKDLSFTRCGIIVVISFDFFLFFSCVLVAEAGTSLCLIISLMLLSEINKIFLYLRNL
jgi:hypothetical protein